MEMPKLERRQRPGEHGEIVDELTPESEILWTQYLRETNLARIAINKKD